MINFNGKESLREMEQSIDSGRSDDFLVRMLYARREIFLATLYKRRKVTEEDLQSIDRIGRSDVATQCWDYCTEEVKEALMQDPHQSVREAAKASWDDQHLAI
jgi:hypothetical protein